MRNKEEDIRDDEIRVIGGNKTKKTGKWVVAIIVSIIAVIVLVGALLWNVLAPPTPSFPDLEEQGFFEPNEALPEPPAIVMPLAQAEDTGKGFIEIADTTINDVPMRLYLPHSVKASLYVGTIDRNDSDILFAAQAADVRADNGGIVGAFVLNGEPLAWGLSKKGYCAIINDTVTVGVAENSPLFEEATEKGGFFFRQFPLVDKGMLVENEQRGKSVRRAFCDRNGEVFTVETLSQESFHDFAQALVDLGVDNAIYLVGASAYGWAIDAEGQRHEFGNPASPKKKWKNISYLVMKARS